MTEPAMPPAILGLEESERAARLALATFDDDRARYDAALSGGFIVDEYPLIWMLVRSWVQAVVVHHGQPGARRHVEDILVGIVEFREELANDDGGAPEVRTPTKSSEDFVPRAAELGHQ
jgi:hypothetical protein